MTANSATMYLKMRFSAFVARTLCYKTCHKKGMLTSEFHRIDIPEEGLRELEMDPTVCF